MARLKTQLKQAAKSVQSRRPSLLMQKDSQDSRALYCFKGTRPTNNEAAGKIPAELVQRADARRDAKHYDFIEVINSKGKKYRVAVPHSYVDNVPKLWKWDERKYRVAEMIVAGVPFTHIAAAPYAGISSRMTIYGWLEHPEFREHVDALTEAMGFAARRERIAGLARMTLKLFDKLIQELDNIRLTDKSIGAMISGIQQNMKQLAQEKGEIVRSHNMKGQTNISGAVTVIKMTVPEVLATKSDEERKRLCKEFNRLGDAVIRNLTDNAPTNQKPQAVTLA